MQEFWQWLIGEAGAGWIVGALSLLGSFYLWLRRERPSHIIIQEIKTLRLMDIHPSQRDKLDIRYKTDEFGEVKTYDLVQKYVVFYNQGTKDILEPLEISFEATMVPESEDAKNNGDTNPFVTVIIDKSVTKEVIEKPGVPNTWTIRLLLPFLNAYRNHQQHLACRFISNQPVELKLLSKTGRGWSARIVPIQKVNEKPSELLGIVIAVLGVFSLLFVAVISESVEVGTPGSPRSIYLLLGLLSLVIVFLGFMVYALGHRILPPTLIAKLI